MMLEVTEKLRQNNLKVTPQRIAIYNALYLSGSHLSAESIYSYLRESYPTISLATVYKTLSTFMSNGLIQELNTNDGISKYDIINEPHPHFVCNVCNTVYDLPELESMKSVRREIKECTNFELTKEQILLYGICYKCK